MYGSVHGASALVPGAGALSATSTPSEAQVTTWLNEATARLDAAIATAGYTTPVAGTTTLMTLLTGYANLYAGAYILAARGIDTASGEGENRSLAWLERFDQQVAGLGRMELAALGATARLATESAARRRPRLRSMQMRRVDGYAGAHVQDSAAYDEVSE